MSKKLIPTLSNVGWVEDMSAKATRLFEYFLSSEDDQSNFYRGNIASFPSLVNKYGNKPQELASNVETVLLHYFRRSFEQVDVTVTHTATDTDNTDLYSLDIDLTIHEDEQLHSLGALLELSGGELIGKKLKR